MTQFSRSDLVRAAAKSTGSPWLLFVAACVALVPTALRAQSDVLDDFESIEGWAAHPSEGATATLDSAPGRDGRALRVAFDLSRAHSYTIARKDFALELPADFQFSFDLRGDLPVNNLEFKLNDDHGNVWWLKKLDVTFPTTWTKQRIRRRQITFAWGPEPLAGLHRITSVEFVISCGSGGKGQVFFDNLRFGPIDDNVAQTARTTVTYSSAAPAPEHDEHGTIVTGWRCGRDDATPWLNVDFGYEREVGGLVLNWDAQNFAPDYDVLLSDDGTQWRTAASVNHGNGGRDCVYLPGEQARMLKLVAHQSGGGNGFTLSRLEVMNPEFGESANGFFAAVARNQPRGMYPRYLVPEQSYWTIVGSPGDASEALLNEDGAIEVDQLSFSLEPFLFVDGKLITWSDVTTQPTLEKDYLPIPSVEWRRGDLALTITALAAGAAGSESRLLATYKVESKGAPVKGRLFVAVRPFQVNPPWQSLQHPAGWARIDRIAYAKNVLTVNDRVIVPLDAPSAVGASAFESGEITEYLRAGRLPSDQEASDQQGFASAAIAYDFNLPAGGAIEFRVAAPFHGWSGQPAANQPRADVDAYLRVARDETRKMWESMLDRFFVRLPAAAQPIINTIKSNLAYIFINQDGPRIQPGSRNYERSWIRDGSLTSTALLELGLFDEVRAYTDWYSQFQFPSGRIPCVVDIRGADPTDEHDSHGEMIYLIRQVHHFTHDDVWLRGKWDTVVKTVRFIQGLRAQRKTDVYLRGTPEQQACYGLVPESISHEGYSAKPMHSYWDDFFILRGLKDAADIATILGETATAMEFAAERDDFAKDLYASMRRAMQNKNIDYIPGCVELGDFDATSTTIGLAPGNELGRIPEPQLHKTFDRYFKRFVQRRDAAVDWYDYTPYENRVIGSFVLLGQKERALATLDWFMAQRRPAAWNHWAEVVFREPRLPRTIGDMPHTWCGSDFMRSVRSLFAYERESDNTLVLGAGINDAWVLDPAGIEVDHLPTYFGPLDYTIKSTSAHDVVVTIGGAIALPAGKIVLKSPLARPIRAVAGDGHLRANGSDEILIEHLPAKVSISY